jgi:hypothetical protein
MHLYPSFITVFRCVAVRVAVCGSAAVCSSAAVVCSSAAVCGSAHGSMGECGIV